MTKAKELPSQEYLKECFDYNPETGLLIWKERPEYHFKTKSISNNKRAGDIAGNENAAGYITTMINGSNCLAHRIIWKIVTGKEPEGIIDHINRVRTDNRFENLRDVGYSENSCNKGVIKSNTSGYKNIRWREDRGYWVAGIVIHGIKYNIGAFKLLDDAKLAYDEFMKTKFLEISNKEKQREFITNTKEMTLDYLHECFRYENGHLYWKQRPLHHFKTEGACKTFNTKHFDKVAGGDTGVYRMLSLQGKHYSIHRLIYWLCTSIKPKGFIDHIDGNKYNNDISNLRDVTIGDNNMNTVKSKANKSGYKGVTFDTKTNSWRYGIRYRGKFYDKRGFESPEAAYAFLCEIRKELHGDFANFG